MSLFACVHAAEFPVQALLRLRPDLQSQPVAVLEGRPPQQTVCAINQKARLCGVTLGSTRLEAEAIAGLKLLARSAAGEASARSVFLECAAQFSPRIEEASQGTACAFVLDIAGTERLFGLPHQLAHRLRAALAAAGFRASIAVSANYHVARMKAAAHRGITVIPEGTEASTLAGLPIAALGLEQESAETFALWGIGTLGELAAMPEADLVARLGAQARQWSALARGIAQKIFAPGEPALSLEEFCEFESPVEQMDSLLFIGARMIDCLAARAASRALALAVLTVRMKLESGGFHERVIRPALPSVDRKFLLKLLQLEIAAHPPQASVLALTLAAQAGQSSQVQLGLFAPQTPEPSRLDVTLARLKAIVGDDRVGSPVLEDTHHASFRMQGFSIANTPGCPILDVILSDPERSEGESKDPLLEKSAKGWEATTHPLQSFSIANTPGCPILSLVSSAKGWEATTPPRIALRRVRPPSPVSVTLRAMKPIAFRDRENRFAISAAYGPWRTSGCWWSAGAWDTEEWDVLAVDNGGASVACLLTCDRARWFLEAFYD